MVVAVEALALERDEQRAAGIGSARVSVATASTTRVFAMQAPAGHARDLRQPQRLHARASQRASAARPRRVVERMLHAVDFLVGLVALAGDQHDVVGAGVADRAGDRGGAVALHDDALAAGRSRP